MEKISRREMLERSMIAAAAASANLGLASAAKAAGLPAEAPSGAKAGANERVRLALVGAGGRGMQHLAPLLNMRDVCEVVAVCDVDDGMAARGAKYIEDKSGKKPAVVKDYRKLLEDKSVDAVSIATPHHWHALQAYWALQAGKDAYVEKPLSHNVWEGRKLVEAAAKYGRVVTQGSQRRSWPSHIEGFKFLHSGKLGALKSVHGICYKGRGSIGKKKDGPVPPGVDYDLWLGPAPARPFNPNRFHYNWHWHWDTGNGDLGNTGVHDMDVIVWGIRKTELPRRAVSLGGRFGYEDDGETPNTQIVALEYADLPITYEVRGLRTEKYLNVNMAAIFRCSDGYLVASNGPVAAFDSNGVKIQDFGARGDDEPHFRNFVEAVRSRKTETLKVGVLDGHLGSGLCHLPNISYRLGEPKPLSTKDPFGSFGQGNECYERVRAHLRDNGVDLERTTFRMGRALTFDPKTETIVGDSEASPLLRREYRKPYVMPESV